MDGSERNVRTINSGSACRIIAGNDYDLFPLNEFFSFHDA